MHGPCRGAPPPAEVGDHDSPSCFSEEEWELVQKWQTDLYENVVKEIHKALISLGPVLSTVFSLRAQGKQELLSGDHEDSSKSDQFHNPNDSHNLSRKESLPLNNIPETEGREESQCRVAGHGDFPSPVKDEDGAFCIEHLDSNSEESIASPSGHETISFPIKEEEDAYCIDHPDSGNEDGATCSSGLAIISFPTKDEEETFCFEHPGRKNQETITSPTADPFGISDRGGMTKKGPRTCREKKRVTHKSTLVHRPEIHADEKLFQCSSCEKRFFKKSYLLQHQRLHGGPRSFPCMDCGKIFGKRSDLQRHEIIHTGEKPFVCTECGKSFTQMSGLKRHQGVHTGENPFPCTNCGKSYTFRSDLHRHQRVHTGEKSFTLV